MQHDQNLQNIPEALKQLNQWVVWGVRGFPIKCPISPNTMTPAKAGQPETWSSFAKAAEKVRSKQAQGVGFEFHNNKIVGVDLDTVRDPESGKVAGYVLDIIRKIPSYTEISVSGYGLHIFCFGEIKLERYKRHLPDSGIQRPDIDQRTGKPKCNPKTGEIIFKRPEIEIYNQGRFFAMTGIEFEEVGRL